MTLTYIGASVLFLFLLLGYIKRYRNSEYIGITDEEIDFSWKLSTIRLDNDSIEEIIILKNRGKFVRARLVTSKHNFEIKSNMISEQRIKTFAINNDITIKEFEDI